jgi:transposase
MDFINKEVIMHVELYHTTQELHRLSRQTKDAKLAARLRAVNLALQGKTAPEIGENMGYSRRTVQNWIYAYNRHGLEGLQQRRGRGRNHRLNRDQLQWLRQRLDQGPTEADGVCVFHAADIQRIIEKQFGVRYAVRTVQKLLRRLGYRYISPRPEHPKGDPQARKAFKKRLSIRSGKSVLYILENA